MLAPVGSCTRPEMLPVLCARVVPATNIAERAAANTTTTCVLTVGILIVHLLLGSEIESENDLNHPSARFIRIRQVLISRIHLSEVIARETAHGRQRIRGEVNVVESVQRLNA